MTQLTAILNEYRTRAKTEREKGTYFEQLIQCYLRNEPSYADLYDKVWMYGDWAKEQGINAKDAGIDLVAYTHTGEFHAVQCKLYAEDYSLQKRDIDSFFTASGKKTLLSHQESALKVVTREIANTDRRRVFLPFDCFRKGKENK